MSADRPVQSFSGCSEKLGHARQQTACRAAIEDAVIETQRHVGFHDRHELAFGFVPIGHPAGGAHAQDQRLLRQRDRGRPGETEGAEVRDGGNRTARGIHREASAGAPVQPVRRSVRPSP